MLFNFQYYDFRNFKISLLTQMQCLWILSLGNMFPANMFLSIRVKDQMTKNLRNSPRSDRRQNLGLIYFDCPSIFGRD